MLVLKFIYKVINRLLSNRLELFRLRKYLDIDPSVRLGTGFSADFRVTPDERVYIKIGESGELNAMIIFESRDGLIEIGNRVHFGGGLIICRSGVRIGNDVTIAWGVTIYDHNSNSLDWRQRAKMMNHFYSNRNTSNCYADIDWTDVKTSPVIIEDKVWIGFDALILKGVHIGEGAIVGARSVVTRNVEPYTVVAGNPAVIVKRLERIVS